MNERARRVNDLRREEIHRILDLVMDINGLDEKKEGTIAFFDFNGAYGELNVNLYEDGYDTSKPADFRSTARSGEISFGIPDSTLFDLADRLEDLKRELRI